MEGDEGAWAVVSRKQRKPSQKQQQVQKQQNLSQQKSAAQDASADRHGSMSSHQNGTSSGAFRNVVAAQILDLPTTSRPVAPGKKAKVDSRATQELLERLWKVGEGRGSADTNPGKIKELLAQGAEVNKPDTMSTTALMHAAKVPDSYFRAIVKHTVDICNERPALEWLAAEICRASDRDGGRSALGFAARRGPSNTLREMLLVLTKSGREAELVNHGDQVGFTALHHSLTPDGRERIASITLRRVEMLLGAGADPNSLSQNGKFPLFLALELLDGEAGIDFTDKEKCETLCPRSVGRDTQFDNIVLFRRSAYNNVNRDRGGPDLRNRERTLGHLTGGVPGQ